jgi:membrane protease YdiL (CAAX protease family)
MFRHLTDPAKAAIFYAITFGLALGIALLPLSGDNPLPEMLSMLTPAVAVLLMLTVVTRDGRSRAAWLDLGLHRSGRALWAAALLGPVLLLLAAYAALWLTPFAGPALPTAAQAPGVTLNALANFAVVFAFALSEEVGWRGYLLPRLLGLGARRATLLTGLLQGLYHLPLMLLTPFYHSEGDRLIVVPMFLLALTLAGPIYGYLRLATGSVWPAAIAHTSLNAAWNLLAKLTVAASPLAAEYLAGESGLLPLLGYAVVAGWCVRRMPAAPRRSAAAGAPSAPAAATPTPH